LAFPLSDSRKSSAAAVYDHALNQFERGYLTLSQQEAESGFERYRESDKYWAAKFQLLEANSMLFRGMYEDALRILSNYRGSEASDGTVERLAIEAVALMRQQRTVNANERLIQAELICQGSDVPTCGDEIAARAILTAKLGHIDDARKGFFRALGFAHAQRNQWLQANSFLNLGYVALKVDHFDEAVDWWRQAYQAAKASGYENVAQTAEGNLGWAYFELGDDDRALEQFQAAEKAAARLGNVRNERLWLSTAGYVYRDSGDWERAAQSYLQELGLARQMNSREDTEIALEDLAQVSVAAGNLDSATAYITQVAPMEMAGGGHLSANLLLTTGQLAAARRDYSKAETLFRSIQRDPASPMMTRLNAGYELARLFQSQNEDVAAGRMFKATLASYEAARARIKSEESQLPYGANAVDIYDDYIRLLVHEGRTGEALAVADQSRAQTLEKGLDPTGEDRSSRSVVLDPKLVAQKTHSALLFYWLGYKESYLWVITPEKTKFFTLPARQEIARHVERYRKVLLELRDPLETGDADGQALYHELVAPAAALIHHGAPVIVLADGALSQLNFETLLDPGAAVGAPSNANSNGARHYLIDDMTLSSAPSLAMLAAAEPKSGAREKILLLGNPVSPNQDYPSLPMFGFEMSRIESHFAPARISAFAGPRATPAAYDTSDPQNYSYIHFVSHAVANQTNPLDSAIILSDPPGQENSYKLYAREIIQHPIDAKLVTISACYGTGTRAYAGEGLVGLSWAFLRAGAQRVIGALWEVSDESTPRLMDSLYQGLTQGASPAAALRAAKLQLLHSQSRFRLPYYWAPFQIYTRR
jgi:CHAT domain-containing protein/uncharacterized protein HemY